jgi:5-methylcytosine-specific restriction endonuclease McrA
MDIDEVQQNIPPSGYLFRIDLVVGGYVYFTTFTEFCETEEKGREVRIPNTIHVETTRNALNELGQCFYIVDSDIQFQHWLERKGWAIVSKDYSKTRLQVWLTKRICLKEPSCTYTAIEISSEISKNRIGSHNDWKIRNKMRNFKETIYKKYGETCLLCNATKQDDVTMTLHHIRPFSKGGATTKNNLIPLCKKCNQNIGNNFLPELYKKIDVIYGYEISLLRGKLDIKTWRWLIGISDNLMHTRCELV